MYTQFVLEQRYVILNVKE